MEHSPSRDNDFIVIDNHELRTSNLLQLKYPSTFNPGSEPRAPERPIALLSYRMDISITSAPVIYYTKRLRATIKKEREKNMETSRQVFFPRLIYTRRNSFFHIQYPDVFGLDFLGFNSIQSEFLFILYRF